MARPFKRPRVPSTTERVGNLLGEHVRFGEWGPRGPDTITLRGRRRVGGGDLEARVTTRRGARPGATVEYWKNGWYGNVERTPGGEFAVRVEKTFSF